MLSKHDSISLISSPAFPLKGSNEIRSGIHKFCFNVKADTRHLSLKTLLVSHKQLYLTALKHEGQKDGKEIMTV